MRFPVYKVARQKANRKTKNKMGGLGPEGHITDPGNTRTEKRSRRRRRMGACSQGRPGPRKGCNVTDGIEKTLKLALRLGVSPGTSVFPCQYHFTIAPHQHLIHYQPRHITLAVGINANKYSQ